MIELSLFWCVVFHIATIFISTSSGNSYYGYDFRAPLKGQGDRGLKTYTEALAVCRGRGAPMATMHTPELHRLAVDQVLNELENQHFYYVDLLWSNGRQRYLWRNFDEYIPNQGFINGFYFEVPSIIRGCVGFYKRNGAVVLRPITCDRKADVLCLIPNPNKTNATAATRTTSKDGSTRTTRTTSKDGSTRTTRTTSKDGSTRATTNSIASTITENSNTDTEITSSVPRGGESDSKVQSYVVLVPIGVSLVLITSLVLFMRKKVNRKKNEKEPNIEEKEFIP